MILKSSFLWQLFKTVLKIIEEAKNKKINEFIDKFKNYKYLYKIMSIQTVITLHPLPKPLFNLNKNEKLKK